MTYDLVRYLPWVILFALACALAIDAIFPDLRLPWSP